MNLAQHIIDLLRHNNCVVVPNFGGFIANYNPAVIDAAKQKITPPSKHVLFNAKLQSNDGLLANYVVEKEGVNYVNALLSIDSKVVTWRRLLKEEKRLDFGEIGYLFEQDGNIVFEQNREVNLLLAAYGLSSVQFVSAEAEKVVAPILEKVIPLNVPVEATALEFDKLEKVEAVVLEEKDEKIIPIQRERSVGKRLGYLAVACAIPLLFYTYWIPMKTDFLETGNIQVSDFNPFHSFKADQTYRTRVAAKPVEAIHLGKSFEELISEMPNSVEVYNFKFDEELYIPVKLDKLKIENENVEIAKSSTAVKTSDVHAAAYQLIAGCFSVEENAYNLMEQLSDAGYEAYILDKHKGLYRVATSGFNSIDSAKEAKANLNANNISTWILSK
ncbi:hypothetical protein DNU06_02750 [Putridiphycobacter roseus]|uniref:SPOR domain-containing protein n=1 Tax=Putridiphycobacter roseus TaxID=2219161 RepID=A0A2W1NGX8_9FLAO|nr:SPOR domain-containing protein [Putridiphycobacter roseus]PZE18765.1 hypothetical protein DNU06_02750 [Putridiphycobacter roseus]